MRVHCHRDERIRKDGGLTIMKGEKWWQMGKINSKNSDITCKMYNKKVIFKTSTGVYVDKWSRNK